MSEFAWQKFKFQLKLVDFFYTPLGTGSHNASLESSNSEFSPIQAIRAYRNVVLVDLGKLVTKIIKFLALTSIKSTQVGFEQNVKPIFDQIKTHTEQLKISILRF